MSYVVPVALAATALAAAGGGYYWWSRHNAAAPGAPGSPGFPGIAPGTPSTPSVGPVAPVGTNDLPAKLQGPYQQLLAQGQDPDAIEVVAQKLDVYGFTSQAAALRVREAALRAAQVVPVSPAVAPVLPLPVAPAPIAPPSPSIAKHARVTTQDRPPLGDLIVRSGPGQSYGQVGGAEKDGVVQVLAWNVLDAGGSPWAQIAWSGGSRWPAVTGYAHQAYLVPTDGAIPSGSGATVSGKTLVDRWSVSGKRLSGTAQRMLAKTSPTGVAQARVSAATPAGLRVRSQPTSTAPTIVVAPSGAPVAILRRSGDWSLVTTNGVRGWAQSRWLEETA